MTSHVALGTPRVWVPPLRWLARILALLSVGTILAFLIGEGVDVPRLTAVEWFGMAGFAALCLGLLLGWWREVAGAVLALLALALFYGVELVETGRFLHGWVWPLLAVPALLYLVCAVAGPIRTRPRGA